MRNRIGNTKIIALIIFILSVSITLGAGYYKTSLAAESAKFQGELTNLHNKPAVIDMGQQGAPKRFVQPDWVSLSTGHGKSGIKNASKDPLYLQIKLVGFPGEVKMDVHDVYDELTGKVMRPIEPGSVLGMTIQIEVPSYLQNQAHIATSEIQFINTKTNSLVGSIPVEIINSRYQDEPNSNNSKQDHQKHEGGH